MGIEASLKGKRVYFDTNIFIYIFEGSPQYQDAIKLVLQLVESEEIEAFTNEITLGELLVFPFKNKQERIARTYIQALNNPDFVALTPTTQDIHIKAAQIRAEYGIKYPDAVHVASALLSACDVFLTNDRKIKAVDPLEMVYLSSPVFLPV